jgi:TRAP-type mannitol/chloroaromatic compound transport system permease large subunit
MAIVVLLVFWMMPWSHLTSGHLGMLMLAMITIAIMLGFPTAFTLMGMGTLFAWLSYRSVNPDTAVMHVLDLVVARAFAVMNNDVLISIPLFVFMGYLVERANLIERLFKSLHLATSRIPGSLAVATIITCTIFATATGIIGAAVTLMGLLAFPAMLKAGYNTRLSAGAVTAGGTLGILIPPSVLLILYGATASVSVVQLYAGAFLPGFMLSGLYIGYIIVSAKIKPSLAPPLSEEDQRVDLPKSMEIISKTRSNKALIGLLGEIKGKRNADIPTRTLINHLIIVLLPLLAAALLIGLIYFPATAPEAEKVTGVQEMGFAAETQAEATKPEAGGLQEPEGAGGLKEPPAETKPEAKPEVKPKAPPAPGAVAEAPKAPAEAKPAKTAAPAAAPGERRPVPMWYWITIAVHIVLFIGFYSIFNFTRLEIFKMLLTSFFPLAMIILGVLGTIVAGLATPTEAAAMGSFGGLVLAAAYGQLSFRAIKEAVFLTAKTSAMVCWLFIGSSCFAAAFALLGGQEVVNSWVLSLDMTPTQFMIMAQVVIFLLGWPLEWTEIIVIFMPIFLPLLTHFNVDPLFFGLLVALNLQTAFLSPPVAMAAFYLKGVSPPHVTLNQIFLGMMPFMGLQCVAIVLLYLFPQIGLWLPHLAFG